MSSKKAPVFLIKNNGRLLIKIVVIFELTNIWKINRILYHRKANNLVAMDIEQIIREAKIVRTADAINILAKYEHPNGLSVELVRKLLFGYKEGLSNSPQIRQTLRSAITYAEHALSQIPEEPERNKGITRGQLSHYLALFYEHSPTKGNENLTTAYEHTTNSINDAIKFRDWSSIAERTHSRKKYIEKLKHQDLLTWTLRGANDSNNTAVELNKKGFPFKNITSGILALASRLYHEASHEFEDKTDAAAIVKLAYECAQNAIACAEPKDKAEKTLHAANLASNIFSITREKKYRKDAIHLYDELIRGLNREIAYQANKKLKDLNRQS